MTGENPRYPNFLDKKNPVFVGFHHSLDNLFRQLREEGVGAESQQTPTIAIEEENMLWDKGILNTSTPKGFFRAVFYYNGKNFVLRGWNRSIGNFRFHSLFVSPIAMSILKMLQKIGVVGWHSCMLSTRRCLSMPIQQLVNVAMCTCLTSTLASFQQQLRRERLLLLATIGKCPYQS